MPKEKDIQYTVNKTGCWNCISHHLRDGYMEHLFLGNDKLNVLDKCVKGRQARGETLSNLTSHKVELMRYCRENTNFTLAKIGELFGVNPRSVHSIISRRTWKHLL